MADRHSFINRAVERASEQEGYMARELKRYMEIEQISFRDLCTFLSVNEDDFNKLALCGVPDLDQPDGQDRLHTICEYANCATEPVQSILLKVALFRSA